MSGETEADLKATLIRAMALFDTVDLRIPQTATIAEHDREMLRSTVIRLRDGARLVPGDVVGAIRRIYRFLTDDSSKSLEGGDIEVVRAWLAEHQGA